MAIESFCACSGGELAATQRKLAHATGEPAPAKPAIDRGSPGWAERIPFHDPGWGEEGGRSFGMNRLRGVGARLKGITSQRDLIVPSSERPELPQPTADEAQLERDFLKWGYCLVAEAMSREQVDVAAERLWDQASAEVAAGTPPPPIATAPPDRHRPTPPTDGAARSLQRRRDRRAPWGRQPGRRPDEPARHEHGEQGEPHPPGSLSLTHGRPR